MRKTPILLRVSPLSHRVYAVTRYTVTAGGDVVAHEKYDVTNEFGEARAELDRLGLEMQPVENFGQAAEAPTIRARRRRELAGGEIGRDRTGGCHMKSVWKFEFAVADTFTIEMPAGAQIIHVATQGDTPCIWALVNTDAETVRRQFRIYGTGHDIKPDGLVHLGSWMELDGALVWHLFENENAEYET